MHLFSSTQVSGTRPSDAVLERAQRLFVEGRYVETLVLCEEAAAACVAAGDSRGAGQATNIAGSVFFEQAAYEEALGRYLAAHDRFREAGDPDGMARAHNNLGLVHWRLGDLARARADFETALAGFDGIGDQRATGNVLNCLGLVAEDEGRLDEARDWYGRAQAVLADGDEPTFLANVLANLADLHAKTGDADQAWTHAEASLALRIAHGHARGVVGSRVSLARLALARGDTERAAVEIAEGLAGAAALGLRKHHADLLELGAHLAASSGAWERAYHLRAEGAELRGSLVGEELARRVAEQRARLDLREANRLMDVRTRENEALREAHAAAEAAARAKSEFVAVMSHEIRTPLTTTIGAMELLRATTLAPRQRELVDAAQGSARSLLTLVEDVLDLSRIEAGRLDLDVRPVDLDALLASIMSEVRVGADERGIGFILTRAEGVPSSGLGDPYRMGQVLLNLLMNAVKFTSIGEVRLAVEPAWLGAPTAAKEALRFVVRDSGIGMAPEVLSRIFEPFVQADSSTTRRYGGTGLGLSIARPLTEAMGGTLEVSSTSGVGSTFTLTLPFPPDANAARDDAPAQEPAPEPAARRAVLLVEDDDDVAEILVAMLAYLGCDVTRAPHADEALLRMETTAFPLVFVDVHMPGMDGFMLASELRDRYGDDPRLIGLSGAASPEDRARARVSGMDDYLTKPVTIERLRDALQRADRRGR